MESAVTELKALLKERTEGSAVDFVQQPAVRLLRRQLQRAVRVALLEQIQIHHAGHTEQQLWTYGFYVHIDLYRKELKLAVS